MKGFVPHEEMRHVSLFLQLTLPSNPNLSPSHFKFFTSSVVTLSASHNKILLHTAVSLVSPDSPDVEVRVGLVFPSAFPHSLAPQASRLRPTKL